MVKLTNVSKSVALGALIGFSIILPARIASADATTNFIPNTVACTSQVVTETKNSGSFTATWNHDNTFTLNVTKAPTSDVSMYASSYHLTSTLYKGGCFSYDASTGTSPQTYDGNTQTITIPAGFTGVKIVTVTLPTTCYNEQVDLYFGDQYGQPLNGTVGNRGHDNYNWIAGNIMLTSKNTACVGGSGAGPVTPPVTPPVTAAPAVTAPAAVVTPTLTNTGLNVRLTSILAAALIAGAAVVFSRRTKVSE